jgi:hypothetical protein
MATSVWNGKEIRTSTPARLTLERRKQLEAGEDVNSLDEALAELEAVEAELNLYRAAREPNRDSVPGLKVGP